ncbi:MAG TPA: malto-oligosyltrehalose trehalohydrolase [Acidimicrobiales bacterium]|nr:malto-oligosyltrehalose trehalohydrolase [Acidimicrobiales bacterium]
MSQVFRVWSPYAARVDVVVGDAAGPRRPMSRVDGRRGWWEAEVPGAGVGTRYAFSVDGGDPRPDPRSPSQPAGVHAFSEVIDHSSFSWTDGGWRGLPLHGSTFYELHVGTFTPEGTFDGVISKLPHLVGLGVSVVELLPVNEFPGGRGWGYDGVDLYAPHHAYGGPEGLKRLVDAAHAAGLGVVIDVVYNHLGPAGNYLGQFGPYFTDRYRTPWGEAVNLDGPDSDEVRRFFLDNALMWLRDYHVDGLRIDAVHAIVDTSALHLLEEMAIEVEALSAAAGRTMFLIAESDLNDPRVVRRRESGGYGIDAQWSDDFHHALHSALTGERSGYYEDFGSLEQVAVALCAGFVYAGEYSPHRRRRHGRPLAGAPAWRLLGYLQNHDQVGNRAQGDRSSMLLAPARLKIAAVLVLLAPFTPMLFMGEEWAASTPFQYFTDHEDAGLGDAVSKGRRAEFAAFGWPPDDVPDPQDPATFQRSTLDWREVDEGMHREVLDWHRSLLALRRARPDLVDGDFASVGVECDGTWLVLHRGGITVGVNLGPGDRTLAAGDDRSVLLSSPTGLAVAGGHVTVPPDGVVVVG